MHRTKNLSRVLSMVLAFCLSVALLPAQAFAATKNDDPATWPAPDSIYTAPEKNPVYLMVDFTDEDNGGIAASHLCASGAALTADIVKATATTGGHVKYTCDTCGSWAQINVPALTLSAFTLDPAYKTHMTTGVEFSGSAYTVVYNVAPAFHRYVGTKLDNHVSVTATGSYGIIITVDSAIYDNVELNTAERLLVLPKAIPWTADFDSKIYDGNSLLDGKTVTYLDVNGASVPAALSACNVKVENGELTVDTASPVTRPVAAGPYAIGATITDSNYVWQTEDGKYNTVYTLAWIFPATNQIYVGDTVQAVKLTTGNNVYASPYTWTIDPSYAGFDSSRPGTTEVQAVITKGGASFGRATIPVTVIPRPILSIEEVVRTAPMGTAFNKLGLPSTVSVVAEGGTGNAQTVTGVPVTWSSTGYDPYALTQTVKGTLNLSKFPQLSGDNIPAVTATVNLTYGTVEAPTISDYTKTYDGQSTALPMPGLPEGIKSVTVAYKGTANNGRPYSSSAAPVNAGSYTAAVSFVMEQGYPQLSGVTVQYVIEKAAQTCPAPTLAASDTSSLTLNTVENAEYSMDGKAHIHTHIEFNSTNLNCDGKFRDVKQSAMVLRRLNDELCRAHGLSVIENPKPSSKKQKEMAAAKYGTSFKERLRQTIDRAIPDCRDYDDFLARMRAEGYEIKEGKLLSFRAPGQERFTRSNRLGADYTREALRERSAHRGGRSAEAKKTIPHAGRKVNMLIDIQAKLAAGKGAGYERWAKIFNLKEAAKTLNFLIENGLTDYDELAARAEQAGDRFDDVSRRIKQLEGRMAEVAQLKTHIINYSKTREIYAAYKKSRHKKEFLAEHGDEIAKHEAAKKAFDALGGKPIPKVAQLSEQYAALLAEKQEQYAEYKALRQDMIAYRTAKQNVDKILGLSPEDQEQNREQKPER